MSLLNFDTSEAVELTVPEPGEYELNVINCELRDSKKGDPMLYIRLEYATVPNSEDINHFIMLPNNDMDPKRHNLALLRLKELEQAFDVQLRNFDPADLVGRRVWGETKVEVYEDREQPRLVTFCIPA